MKYIRSDVKNWVVVTDVQAVISQVVLFYVCLFFMLDK